MRKALKGLSFGTVLFASLAVPATAQDGPSLFPQSKISAGQWQRLYNQVRSKPGHHVIVRRDLPAVVAIEVPGDRSIYYFAKSGPAYPAVLVAHVVQQDAHIYLEKSGYFAGIETEFSHWFDALNVKTEDYRDLVRNLPPS